MTLTCCRSHMLGLHHPFNYPYQKGKMPRLQHKTFAGCRLRFAAGSSHEKSTARHDQARAYGLRPVLILPCSCDGCPSGPILTRRPRTARICPTSSTPSRPWRLCRCQLLDCRVLYSVLSVVLLSIAIHLESPARCQNISGMCGTHTMGQRMLLLVPRYCCRSEKLKAQPGRETE